MSLDFNAVEATLTDALLDHFASAEAYALHSDVLPFIARLDDYRRHNARHLLLPAAVASGSDPSCVSLLGALGVLSSGAAPPTTNSSAGTSSCPPGLAGAGLAEVYTTWEVGFAKHDPRFWREVGRRVSEASVASGGRAVELGEVVVVGDDYEEDYVSPRGVGMRALLLRRPPDEGEGKAVRAVHRSGKSEAEEEAEAVASLVEVVDYLEKVNSEEML